MIDKEVQKVLLEKFDNDVKTKPRWLRLLIVVDQFFSVLLWNSSQDETISSHVGRRITEGKANWFDKVVCCALKKMENNHCKESLGE